MLTVVLNEAGSLMLGLLYVQISVSPEKPALEIFLNWH